MSLATAILDFLLVCAAAAVCVPAAVFCLECVSSLLPLPQRGRRAEDARRPRARVAVLIPAHDEEAGIAETLRSVLPALGADDRCLVVADNCSDGTAEVARSLGADVVERHDRTRRGKPFALQCGLESLSTNPPDVVLVVDADCRIDAHLVETIARHPQARIRPLQALNLSEAESDAGQVGQVSTLGFRFKNLVRPWGSAAWNGPCHLMGTGMAVPWDLALRSGFASTELAEDMQLGVEAALGGQAASFVPDAGVWSRMPAGRGAFVAQRTRWEHGHLRTSLTQIPRLLRGAALGKGLSLAARLDLVLLAADLTIPPLSLLIASWMATTAACVAWGAATGLWTSAALCGAAGAGLACGVAAGWFAHCRSRIPLRSLSAVPFYVLRKLPIYARFLWRRERTWKKTEREPGATNCGRATIAASERTQLCERRLQVEPIDASANRDEALVTGGVE